MAPICVLVTLIVILAYPTKLNGESEERIMFNFPSNVSPCPIKSAQALLTTHTEAAKDTTGTIKLIDNENGKMRLEIEISGMEPNSVHGLHIHTLGNLVQNCNLTGVHFNPLNKTHGGPDSRTHHVGDIWANVEADGSGKCVNSREFSTSNKNSPRLCGNNGIVGRSIVLHQNRDDLGKGDAPTSSTTGNSGAKIVCGVFGILTEAKK